jgi:hypothetical protein
MTPFHALSFTRPHVLLDVADGSLKEVVGDAAMKCDRQGV